jgi:glucose/mannose-6-phosphate isomerase
MDRYTENALRFNEQLSFSNLSFSHIEKLRGNNPPDAIIIVGMGGSGFIANLLQNLSGYVNIKIPIIPWKDFGLPSLFHVQNPFFIFVSFSGNTHEVLSGFRAIVAREEQPMSAVVTGGGALLQEAEANGIPAVTFPKGDLLPRQGVGSMFYGILGILKEVLLDVNIPDLRNRVIPSRFLPEAKKIAKSIGKKYVVVYGTEKTAAAAYFWKTDLNETGKTPCFVNTVPEIDHNEIVGFESGPKDFVALFLEDQDDAEEMKRLIPIIVRSLKKFGVPAFRIKTKGASAFERVMNAIALGELVAISVIRGKGRAPDHKEAEIVTYVKKQLAKK